MVVGVVAVVVFAFAFAFAFAAFACVRACMFVRSPVVVALCRSPLPPARRSAAPPTLHRLQPHLTLPKQQRDRPTYPTHSVNAESGGETTWAVADHCLALTSSCHDARLLEGR